MSFFRHQRYPMYEPPLVPIRATPQGAVVEIIDVDGGGWVICPSVVRINGTDVGLMGEDGVTVTAGGPHEPSTVVLHLLPSKVTIASEERA